MMVWGQDTVILVGAKGPPRQRLRAVCVPEQGHNAFKDSSTIVKNLMCSQNGCTKGLLRCKGNREMVLPPLSVGSPFGNSGCWRERVGLVGEGLRGAPIVLQPVHCGYAQWEGRL